ncbi:MAG: amidohydrolase family protein [Acidimicrobiaceae bacterium]|nr:amidohydrolase family protein [Acidimicrobiaceae bacterium]
MTSAPDRISAEHIRERVGHPLVDGDGHLIEVREAFVRFVDQRGQGRLLEEPRAHSLLVPGNEQVAFPPAEERRRFFSHKPHFWITPANTLDYAAVTMPGLMYERLPETGFDFSVIYPTYGIHLAHIPGEASRRGLCRLYNEMVAEDFAPYRDRLSPVAVLPLSTPEEGVEELEHAHALGLRAFLMPSYVWRRIPAFTDAPPEYGNRLQRMDTFGVDSEYDYDPFWKRATELDAPLSAHMSGAGLPDHVSPSNSFFSAGHFAATGEMLAKSLFLGGVLHRFPTLRVALLEGGVAVGVRLYGDLVSRFEKRGPEGITKLDPRRIDTAALARLAPKYNPRLVGVPDELLVPALRAEEGGANDFEASGVQSAKDIRDQFCRGLYWGCEGDDPLIGVAFDQRINPLGAVLPAFVGSDIGHWDVPSFDHPLHEAYEQVEHGLLTAEQFKAFTFLNAVRFYAGGRSDFFAGTALEADARAVIEQTT